MKSALISPLLAGLLLLTGCAQPAAPGGGGGGGRIKSIKHTKRGNKQFRKCVLYTYDGADGLSRRSVGGAGVVRQRTDVWGR